MWSWLSNDRAAIGALAAIKNNGLNRKLSIYGVDGSPDIKNFFGYNKRYRGDCGPIAHSDGTQGGAGN